MEWCPAHLQYTMQCVSGLNTPADCAPHTHAPGTPPPVSTGWWQNTVGHEQVQGVKGERQFLQRSQLSWSVLVLHCTALLGQGTISARPSGYPNLSTPPVLIFP